MMSGGIRNSSGLMGVEVGCGIQFRVVDAATARTKPLLVAFAEA